MKIERKALDEAFEKAKNHGPLMQCNACQNRFTWLHYDSSTGKSRLTCPACGSTTHCEILRGYNGEVVQ